MIPVNTIHSKAPVPSPSKGLRSCKGFTEPAPKPAPKRPSKMAMPRATATPASMPDHEIPLPTLIPKRFLPYSLRFSSFINAPQLSWEVYLSLVHESCQRQSCPQVKKSFCETELRDATCFFGVRGEHFPSSPSCSGKSCPNADRKSELMYGELSKMPAQEFQEQLPLRWRQRVPARMVIEC